MVPAGMASGGVDAPFSTGLRVNNSLNPGGDKVPFLPKRGRHGEPGEALRCQWRKNLFIVALLPVPLPVPPCTQGRVSRVQQLLGPWG